MKQCPRLIRALLVPSIGFAQEEEKKLDQRVDAAIQEALKKLRDLQPPKWTYSELAAQSDLIVVAKLISRSEIQWDESLAGDFNDTSVKCLSNRMRVLSTLKGDSGDKLEVVTLGLRPNALVLINVDFAEFRTRLLLPRLVQVDIDGEITGYGGSSPIETYTIEPEYLVYLRKLKDNQYVPVTGQRFSGMSVRILND